MIDLSIVIVNYNVKDLVVKNLQSIFGFTKDISYKVFLVDNGSKDGSVECFMDIFKNEIESDLLKIYNTKNNNGFAKGNNIPLNDIDSEYILYMNPDMEIMDNVFYKQIEFMKNNPQAGFSTCMLKYPDGEIQHNIKGLPTFIVNLIVLLKLHHFLKNDLLKKYFLSNFDYSKTQLVEQIMGAFVFAKKEAINEIGAWNEDYWLWWEDVDLCKKVKDLKLNILYNPNNCVTHYEGKSFFQLASLDRQKRFNKGMLIYSKKYFPYYKYFILKLFSYVSLLLALVTQILKVKPRGQGKI